MREILVKMNKNFMFTINSQPRVNGEPSSSSIHGWGPKNGFIYQKAYVEFFIHPKLLDIFIDYANKNEWISYHAINSSGETKTNTSSTEVNAVTWGVFKSKEILQPTVVDSQAFAIWKDEAFSHWSDWSSIYEEASDSSALLNTI